MTSCVIRNYRPKSFDTVSGAEYIGKKEFKTQHKFQNDGLPSGVYGFITNRDDEISDDEKARIMTGELRTDFALRRAFLLDDEKTSIDHDEYARKFTRNELFRTLSYGMVYQAKVKLGCRDEYDINVEGSSYHINNLEMYKEELGIDSDITVKDAIDVFLQRYRRANDDGLLLHPIRYLLAKYDGICNYANNTASGGSIYFEDINPRVGTREGSRALFAFKSKNTKSSKKSAKKSAKKKKSIKKKHNKKSARKRKSAKKNYL